MHKPNMEIPILNGLKLKCSSNLKFKNLNFFFKKPDSKKFPIIRIGYKILRDYGQAAMILFTVFNDRLAKLYLYNKIKYGDISFFLVKTFAKKSLKKYLNKNVNNISDVMQLIKIGQETKLK